MATTQQLPPETTQHLDMPEGTLAVRWVGGAPLKDPPSHRFALIAGRSPLLTQVTFELDEAMHLHFVRQVPGGEPADVAVDISSLRGARRLDIYGAWSPTHMAIHVINPNRPNDLVTASVGDPPSE
jgi:hypothetical protein